MTVHKLPVQLLLLLSLIATVCKGQRACPKKCSFTDPFCDPPITMSTKMSDQRTVSCKEDHNDEEQLISCINTLKAAKPREVSEKVVECFGILEYVIRFNHPDEDSKERKCLNIIKSMIVNGGDFDAQKAMMECFGIIEVSLIMDLDIENYSQKQSSLEDKCLEGFKQGDFKNFQEKNKDLVRAECLGVFQAIADAVPKEIRIKIKITVPKNQVFDPKCEHILKKYPRVSTKWKKCIKSLESIVASHVPKAMSNTSTYTSSPGGSLEDLIKDVLTKSLSESEEECINQSLEKPFTNFMVPVSSTMESEVSSEELSSSTVTSPSFSTIPGVYSKTSEDAISLSSSISSEMSSSLPSVTASREFSSAIFHSSTLGNTASSHSSNTSETSRLSETVTLTESNVILGNLSFYSSPSKNSASSTSSENLDNFSGLPSLTTSESSLRLSFETTKNSPIKDTTKVASSKLSSTIPERSSVISSRSTNESSSISYFEDFQREASTKTREGLLKSNSRLASGNLANTYAENFLPSSTTVQEYSAKTINTMSKTEEVLPATSVTETLTNTALTTVDSAVHTAATFPPTAENQTMLIEFVEEPCIKTEKPPYLCGSRLERNMILMYSDDRHPLACRSIHRINDLRTPPGVIYTGSMQWNVGPWILISSCGFSFTCYSDGPTYTVILVAVKDGDPILTWLARDVKACDLLKVEHDPYLEVKGGEYIVPEFSPKSTRKLQRMMLHLYRNSNTTSLESVNIPSRGSFSIDDFVDEHDLCGPVAATEFFLAYPHGRGESVNDGNGDE